MELSDRDRQHIALALRVQEGDRDAFAELVTDFQGRVFNFVFHFFRDRDLAEEVTQETFLRAYRFIKRFDSERKFSTWLFAIAKNLCIDEQRRGGRGATISMEDVPLETDFADQDLLHQRDPASIASSREEGAMVEEALAELPEKYRSALILCYYEEMPYQEIAAVLDLSVNLVKVRIFRAKKMLLQILKRREAKAGKSVTPGRSSP